MFAECCEGRHWSIELDPRAIADGTRLKLCESLCGRGGPACAVAVAPGAGLAMRTVLAFCWVLAQPLLAEPWVALQGQEPLGYQKHVPISSLPAEKTVAAERWGPSEEQRWRQQQTALQWGRRSLAELQQVLGAPMPQDPAVVRALSIVHSLAAQRRFRQAKAALLAARPLLEEAVLHQEVNLLRFEMGEAPPFLTNRVAADEWLAARIPVEEAGATVRPDGTLTSTGRLKQMTSGQLAMALDVAQRLPDSEMTRRPAADEPVFARFSSGSLEGESPLSPRRRSPVPAEVGSEEPLVRSNPVRSQKRHLVLVQVLALTLGCFVLVITCGQLRHVGSLAGPSWKTHISRQACEGSDSTTVSTPSKDRIEEEMLKLPLSESNHETEVMKDWYEEEPMRPEEGKVIEHAIYTPDGSPVHRLAPVGLLVTPMQLPQLFQAGVLPNGRIQGPMLIPVPATEPQVLPAPCCMATVLPAPGPQDAACMSVAEEEVPAEETPKLEPEDVEEQVPTVVDQVPEQAPSRPWGFAGVGRWADAEESSGNSEAEGRVPVDSKQLPASSSFQDSARQLSPSYDAVAVQEPRNKHAQDAERRKKKAGRRKKVPAREANPPPPNEEEPKRVIRLEELLGLKPSDGLKNPGPSPAPGAADRAALSRQTSQPADTARPAAHKHDPAAGTPIPMASIQKPRKGRPKKPQAALASAPLPRSGRQWRAAQRHVAAEEG